MLALATWRWQMLLRRPGRRRPRSARLTASYLVATFFNNFLPSNIGGDIVRVRDSSQPDRLDDHLARRRRDRPHPRLRRALRCSPPSPSSLAPPVVRGLAGARVVLLGLALLFGVLAYVFFRPGTARRLMAALAPRLASAGCASSSRSCRAPCTSTARGSGRSGSPAPRASSSRPSSSSTTWPSPARSASRSRRARRFLMVPLCTLLQARARLLQRLGPARGPLRPLLRPGRPAPRQRPRLLASWAPGLMVLLSLSGAVVWMARGSDAPRRRGRLSGMAVPVLHVCDKFGVRGSSIHGVSRLFSWWFPRYDRARFDVSLVRPQAPRARHGAGSASRASRSTTSAAGASTRASSADLVAPRPRRAARASCTCTATPPPTSAALAARAAGAQLVLHEHFADPRMPALPGPRRPAPRALHGRRHRREPLDPRLPGRASASSPRSACASSGTARRSTSSRPCPRERALRVRRELGHPRRRPRRRHDRPPQRAEGPPLPPRRRGARPAPRRPARAS